MAAKLKLKSLTKAVSDSAAPLSATDLWVRQLVILNPSGGSSVYVGDSGVTDTASFPVAAGATLSFDAHGALMKAPNQINLKDVYAVCASGGSANLKILYLVEEFDQIAPL
jgi:hypothetical protein